MGAGGGLGGATGTAGAGGGTAGRGGESLAPRKSGGTRVGLVVALVVVMAAGAAAWFTHLIPHP
jgi:hypothetical protein